MTQSNKTFLQDSEIPQNVSTYFSNFFEASVGSYVLTGFIIIISILGMVGNGTVLWFLCFHLKKNSFIFITNLAIADFGVLFVSCSKYLLVLSVHLHIYFNEAIYITDTCLFAFYCFTIYASGCFLTAISTDRCLAVLFPIWYRYHRPKSMLPMFSAFLWALACLLSGLVLFSLIRYGNLLISMILFYFFESCIIIPTLILSIKVYCYSHLRRRGRFLKAVLLSLCFFIVTVFPQSFFFLMQDEKKAYLLHALLNSLNSSVNPAIYVFFGRRRSDPSRKLVKVALQRVFKEEEDSREGGQPSENQISL